ncbi:MAG TPA: TIR domain-containing protein [Thermoanaerobaculia bacterium]|nr:TIR domain-containing protein [Thermoanaerobaculia bacterium]
MSTPPSAPQFDLFLSHNSRDKELVEPVAERLLEEFGVVSWLDIWAIPAAADWRAEIERGLLACRGCMVFIGGSGWGEFHLAEARRALEHRAMREDFVVVPVVLPGARDEDLAVLAELFSERQRVDLTGAAAEEESLRRVAAAIRREQPFPLGRPRMSPYTIRRDANRWTASGRKDASILYRGRTLAAAQQLATTYSGQLDATAFRFLTAAVEAERRRLRFAAGGAAAVVLAILTLLVLTLVSRHNARTRLASLYVEQGRDALLRRDPSAALYLHAALELDSRDPDLRFLLARALQPLSGQVASLNGHTDAVNETAISPDGRTAATAGADHLGGVWSLPAGTPLCALRGHRAGIRTIRFHPDGSRLLTASLDLTARIWDARTCRPLLELTGHGSVVSEAAWSGDGRYVVTASYDGSVRVWDAGSGRELAALKGTDAVGKALFAGDDVVSGDSGGVVRVWDWRRNQVASLSQNESVSDLAAMGDGRVVIAWNAPLAVVWSPATNAHLILRGDDAAFAAVAVSPDRSRVIASDNNGVTRMWDARSGAPLQPMQGEHGFTESAAFDRSGRLIVTAGSDGTAKVWRAADGALLAVLDGLQGKLRHAAFNADGSLVATSGADGRAIVWKWRAARGPYLWRRRDAKAEINQVRFAGGAPRLVTGSDDGTAIVYDTGSGGVASRVTADDVVESVDLSDDGRRVALAIGRAAEIRNVATGALLHRLEGHRGTVRDIRFAPAGTTLATASEDHTARLWDTRSGTLRAALPHGDQVLRLMYDEEGTRLLTTSLDFTAALWDAERGTRLRRLDGHLSGVEHAALSGDAAIAVTAEKTARLRVWNASSGRQTAELTGHSGYINDCTLNRDATRIGSAGSDGTARIWDTAGRLLHTLGGHEGRVVSIRFSPWSELAATVNESAEVRVWSVATGRLLARFPHGGDFATVAEFTPDGNALVTGDGGGRVSLWSLDADERTAGEIAPMLARLLPARLQDGRAVPVRQSFRK